MRWRRWHEAYDRSGDGKTGRAAGAAADVDGARRRRRARSSSGSRTRAAGIDRKLWVGWRWIDARQPERARAIAEAAAAR